MIKLNRTTEYGLMALRHMDRKASQKGFSKDAEASQNPKELTSAREIADSYGLPFEITAKTLQRLKETGLIESCHGAKGGYTLHRPLNEISLAEFLELMEGPQSLVTCTSAAEETSGGCEYGGKCEIKHVMNHLNARVYRFLSSIQLAELADNLSFPVQPALETPVREVKKEA